MPRWTQENTEQLGQGCLAFSTAALSLVEQAKRLVLKYQTNVAGQDGVELGDAAAMDKDAMLDVLQLAAALVALVDNGTPLNADVRSILGRALRNAGV